MTDYIMVLNDGETFTDLSGCKILSVPEELPIEYDNWEDYIRRNKGLPYVEFQVHGDLPDFEIHGPVVINAG